MAMNEMDAAPRWWAHVPPDVRAALPSIASDGRQSMRYLVGMLENKCPQRNWKEYEAQDYLIAWGTWRCALSCLRSALESKGFVVAVEFMPVGDGVTKRVCRSRNGLFIPMDEPLLWQNIPPLHWGCRTTLSPISEFECSPARLAAKLERARKKLATIQPLPNGFGALPPAGLEAAIHWAEAMESRPLMSP
jgi:hypothetical protein